MSDSTVLITGCSRGLGRAMVEEFHRNGWRVLGASRSEPPDELPLADWFQVDLTDDEQRAGLVNWIETKHDGELDVLINNAGIGHYDTWDNTPESDLRKLFEINVFALMNLSRDLLPVLEKRPGRAGIINMSSIAGRMPVACMGPYCATKFAVRAFSDSLRMELQPKGIHVMTLIVGRIPTGFSDHCLGTRTPPSSPGGSAASPEALARKVYRGFAKRKRTVVYPGWYRLAMLVPWLLPGFFERQNRKAWGLDQESSASSGNA